MKLNAAEADALGKSLPPKWAGVLLFGPDEGQVRDRARTIGRQVAADLHDPFQVVELTGPQIADDPAVLADAVLSPSLMGGRRLVRVNDAGDKLGGPVKGVLTQLDPAAVLLLILGGDLGKTSALRKVFEADPTLAAIGCYADEGKAVGTLLQQELAGITLAPDARTWLLDAFGTDRMLIRGELEKLRLYAGDSKQLSLADVQAAATRVKAAELDEFCLALFEGKLAVVLRAWDALALEGLNPVGCVRILQNFLWRLLSAKAAVASGTPLATAMKQLKPPVFFKTEARFGALVERWQLPTLYKVQERLLDLEIQCKTQSTVAELLLRQMFTGLAARRR
jgi:DNA polymerase-3 subunit delta